MGAQPETSAVSSTSSNGQDGRTHPTYGAQRQPDPMWQNNSEKVPQKIDFGPKTSDEFRRSVRAFEPAGFVRARSDFEPAEMSVPTLPAHEAAMDTDPES